jgi:hypothetical protein
VRSLALGALLVLVASSAALAAARAGTIGADGVRLGLPAGWHGSSSSDTACDPRRLLVASSAAIQFHSGLRLAAPARGQVLVAVLEDRGVRDRPVGGLRRPRRFDVAWNHLSRLDGGSGCGLPATPAYLRYFESHRRYIGVAVFPGSRVSGATRARTLGLLDSIRVSARPG